FVDQYQLIDAGAPAVAGLAARCASDGAMQTLRRRQTEVGEDLRLARRWRRCLSALDTQATYEPLRQHAAHRRRQKVRLVPHVGKARNGADRIVVVQGRT